MPLSHLNLICGRVVCLEVCDAGESVGPGAIGEVVESAPANVRHIDAEAEFLLTVCVGRKIGSIKVIFSTPRVGLRPTSRK